MPDISPRDANRIAATLLASNDGLRSSTQWWIDPITHRALVNATSIPTPVVNGNLSKFHLVSGAGNNATNVKAASGQLYMWTVYNTTTNPLYVKFHDTAATPTPGSGVTDALLVPGNTGGAGNNFETDFGIPFTTGIAITTTAGAADADTSAVTSGALVINLYYI